MTNADVLIVGAGPTGLMPAAELRPAGVRPPAVNAIRRGAGART
ncbi:FAD-dependent monooxygenase [Streptosporangium sandarakinum]